MIYTADISTAASTSKANAQKTVLPVSRGLVYKVDFVFPAGSTGLLYCLVTDGLHQVWPSSPGVWFRGDNDVISFEDTYLKLSPPYEFCIYTYNLDDTYNHSVIVKVGLVSSEIFMARFLPTYTYKYFIDMLDKLEAEQQTRAEELLQQPFLWGSS